MHDEDPGSGRADGAPAPVAPSGWRADVRAVGPPWLAARVLVALAALLAGAMGDHWDIPRRALPLAEGLFAWDGAFYRDIATVGYTGLPTEALRFFPLYPLLGRGLGAVLLDHPALALVLVANAASFVAAVLLRRLARHELGDDAPAARVAWLTALFPTAFVLVWAYAEGLFLVAAVGAFLAARRGRWWWAAAAGLAAALTRPVGVLLVVPLLIEAVRAWRDPDDGTGAGPPALGRTGAVGAVVAVGAPVVGLAAYLAYVGARFGDALAPFTVQTDLRGEANPLVRLVQGFGDLVGPERFGDGLHIPFAVVFVALLVVVFRRLPASYGWFTTFVLLAALSADNLNSLERYGLNAFPLLLALAIVLGGERRERLGLAVGGCGLVALCSLAWFGVYVP